MSPSPLFDYEACPRCGELMADVCWFCENDLADDDDPPAPQENPT